MRALWWVVVMASLVAAGCEGEGEVVRPSGWVEAAEVVRPSVHSVWGSRAVLEGGRTAFAPLGTAFVLATHGVLITNAHVVLWPDGSAAPRLHVLIQTDTSPTLFPARVVAADTGRDLALLQIGDSTLAPVRWARERAPVGTPLATLAYGLPEGGIVDTAEARVVSRFTVFPRFTAGYSSGYRTLEPGDPSTNVLEVDLPFFPGVSGGPTFREDARVLGVNRGRRDFGGGVSTYGHVIPRLVVRQFLAANAGVVGIDTTRVFGGSEAPE